MATKVFNDPVHGHIELHALCVRIIDTPQFQRLRRIKQLGGCYFVYPGASHNRFEHSLGVCYLAGELLKKLQSEQKELTITKQDILCVQIAGLCHDLGHGPFSHMFDNKFIPQFEPEWKHEAASVEMFDHLFGVNNLRSEFDKYDLSDTDITFIKEQIAGKKGQYEGRRNPSKSFLYEIVANRRNGVDVDKWDYLARDCYHLGIKSNFDHNRFMKFVRVIEVEGQRQICSREKEVHNLYDMFHTRAVLHRFACQHKTTAIIEQMIVEALTLANDHIKIKGKDGAELKISETIHDMVAYSKLDDSIYLRILHSEKSELAEARGILDRIERRKHYRLIGQTKPDTKTKQTRNVEIMKKDIEDKMVEVSRTLSPEPSPTLNPSDIIILVSEFDYGMKAKNPIDEVRFYSKSDTNKAMQFRREEVSDMLPQRFSEQSIRVYYKNADKNAANTAAKCLHEACTKLGLQVPKIGDPELTPVPNKTADVRPRPSRRCRKRLQFTEDHTSTKKKKVPTATLR